MSKKKKAEEVRLRWIKRNEEIPMLRHRLPGCRRCRKKGIFRTARGMWQGMPVCDEHLMEMTEDISDYDLTIDEERDI